MKKRGAHPRWQMIKRLLLRGLAVTILLMLMEPILVSFVPLPPALFAPPPPAVELLDRNGEPLRLTRDGDRPSNSSRPFRKYPRRWSAPRWRPRTAGSGAITAWIGGRTCAPRAS